MRRYDILVIGAGPGGYPAAIRAAQLGASVAVVERQQLGGVCLNCGCIPTKLLIGAAEIYHGISRASALGIKADGVTLDYATLAAHKDKTVARLRNGVAHLLRINGVEVIPGSARFQSLDRVTVTAPGSGPVEVSAGKVIIATGSTSNVPAVFPEHPRIVESRGFLELMQLPRTLLVVGGGYIGCELAGLAARLGVQVTVVEVLEEILAGFDSDVRREVRLNMERYQGVRILTGQALTEVFAGSNGVSGVCAGHKLEADLMLVATGRKPVTDGLGLDQAGLQPDIRGFLPVNEFGQTAIPTIYAVGDVNGVRQLAHAATAQGTAVAEHACGQSPRAFETLVPGVVFTSPEVGTVGLTEQEARERGIAVEVGRFAFHALGRSIASGQTAGFAKWIARAGDRTLLGAAVVGSHATESIAEAVVAIRSGLKVADLGSTIHAHPTFGEIWHEAAHALEGRAIHGPAPKRP
jgi:dihydrolipoamide dehydrogenase